MLRYCRALRHWQCHWSSLETYCSCGFYFLLKVLRELRRILNASAKPEPACRGKWSCRSTSASTSMSPGQDRHSQMSFRVQQSSAKMARGLERLAEKERLRELAWRKDGKRENLTASLPLPKGRWQKRWRQILLKGVQWKDNGHKLQAGKFWWDRRKKFFLVRMIKDWNRFPKRLQHLCSQWFSKLNWIRSWPTCSTSEITESQTSKKKNESINTGWEVTSETRMIASLLTQRTSFFPILTLRKFLG